MVVGRILEDYRDNLMEAIMVLSKLLDRDKAYIYAHLDEPLEAEVMKEFRRIMDRLEEGWPIQYLLKERNFMGLDFFVDQGVLIPRNDTEVLVEYIIDYAAGGKKKILELGYGSGAIALSLGYYLEDASITGIDISERAYEIASKNKKNFQLENVELVIGDLFEPLAGSGEKFDIIVSNPPYIKRKVIQELDPRVRDFEPGLALDGGEDGLDFYRRISQEASDYLVDSGMLIYEIGYDQSEELETILRENNFSSIERLKDLQGYDRVILGFK